MHWPHLTRFQNRLYCSVAGIDRSSPVAQFHISAETRMLRKYQRALSDEFAANRWTRQPIAILSRASRRRIALRQQLIKRIAPPLFGIDDEFACVDRKADRSIGGETEGVKHRFWDRHHDRSADFAKSCSVRHCGPDPLNSFAANVPRLLPQMYRGFRKGKIRAMAALFPIDFARQFRHVTAHERRG